MSDQLEQDDPHDPMALLPAPGDVFHPVTVEGNEFRDLAVEPLDRWGHYYGGGFATPDTVVREYCGADTPAHEVDGIAALYRDHLNAVINEHGVYLRGAMFFAEPHAVDTAEDVITQAIEHVDLPEVAAAYDRHQAVVKSATDQP